MHWVLKKCSGHKRLTEDPDYRCTLCQGTARPSDGRPQREVGPDKLEVVPSFCYQGDILSAGGGCELSITSRVKQPERSSRSCYQFSLPATSLSRLEAVCTALVCGAQCSMPVRLGPWQCRTFNTYSRMTGQWSDRSAMSSHKTLLPLGRTSCMRSLASKTWTSSWRRKDSCDMDTFNDQKVPSSQPMKYRLKESGGLGGPRWPGSSWQRRITESGSCLLSTLMIETPGDLVWDLPCVQLASYLEGGLLMWKLSLNLHVNQKSCDDDDDGRVQTADTSTRSERDISKNHVTWIVSKQCTCITCDLYIYISCPW